MKNGKKPNLKQIGILSKNKMEPDNWLINKVFPDRLICTHRISNETKPAFLKVAAI